MTRVSIQDLKARISSAVAEAEQGGTVVITRHNRPVAQLTAHRTTTVRVGARYGRATLKPAITTGTNGVALRTLLEDRRGTDGR